MLSDRVFFGACAGLAALVVALALIWPQGEGARSPWPFGHTVVIPSYVAAKKKRDETRTRQHAPLRPALKPETPKS